MYMHNLFMCIFLNIYDVWVQFQFFLSQRNSTHLNDMTFRILCHFEDRRCKQKHKRIEYRGCEKHILGYKKCFKFRKVNVVALSNDNNNKRLFISSCVHRIMKTN